MLLKIIIRRNRIRVKSMNCHLSREVFFMLNVAEKNIFSYSDVILDGGNILKGVDFHRQSEAGGIGRDI